jgi:hypothetical protein
MEMQISHELALGYWAVCERYKGENVCSGTKSIKMGNDSVLHIHYWATNIHYNKLTIGDISGNLVRIHHGCGDGNNNLPVCPTFHPVEKRQLLI